MAKIILDISANTHQNSAMYLKRMLDELKAVDSGKHEIIIKHQLFVSAGNNIPLDTTIFHWSYHYAEELGYKTTSSVFDLESLKFLLRYDVPFIKIANNRNLDWLIGEIPRKIPVYVSAGNIEQFKELEGILAGKDKILCCVSKYPCSIDEYKNTHAEFDLYEAISDHTTDFQLYHDYMPNILEIHYKLEDSTGLDAGEFARTPEQLKEIL